MGFAVDFSSQRLLSLLSAGSTLTMSDSRQNGPLQRHVSTPVCLALGLGIYLHLRPAPYAELYVKNKLPWEKTAGVVEFERGPTQ
jgi:hypothetical protein